VLGSAGGEIKENMATRWEACVGKRAAQGQAGHEGVGCRVCGMAMAMATMETAKAQLAWVAIPVRVTVAHVITIFLELAAFLQLIFSTDRLNHGAFVVLSTLAGQGQWKNTTVDHIVCAAPISPFCSPPPSGERAGIFQFLFVSVDERWTSCRWARTMQV